MQPKSSSGQQASSTASSSSSNSSATEKRDDKQTRGEIENRSQGQASARAEAATAGVVVAVDAPPPPPQLECGAPPATTSTAQRSFGAPARENQFGSCQTGQVNNKGGASEPVVVPTTTTNEEGNKKKEVNKKDEKRSVENGKQPPASAQASAHRGPKVDTGNERQEQLREHQQVSNSSSNNSNEQSTDRRQVEELRQFRLGDYNCANNRSGERWHETCVTQAKVEAAPGTAKTSRQTSCSSLVRGVEEITQTTSVGPPQWGQPPVPLVDTPSPGPSQISGRAAAAEAEAYRSPLARPRPIQQHSGVRQQISCGLVEGIQQKQQQQQQQQQRPTRTTSADEQVPVSSQGLRLPEQNSRIQRQSSAPTNEQANDEQRGGHQEEDQRQADTWRPPQPLPAGRQQRIKVTLSRPRTESCEQESCEDQEQLRRNHHQHQLEQSSVSGGPCGEHNNNNHHQHRRSSPDTASHLSESSSQVNFVFGQSPRTRGQSTATLISGSIEQIATVVAGEGQQQQIDPSDQTRTVADAAAVAGASDLSAAKRLSDLVASDRPSCAQTGANFKPLRLSRSEQDNQLRRIASERRRVGGARPEPGAGLKTAKAEAGATTTSVVIGQQRQQQLSQKTADPIQTSRPLTLEASDKNNYLPSGPAASSSKQNEALNCTANSKTVSVPRPPPPDTSSLLVKPSNTAAALAANDRVGDEVAAGLGGAAGGLSPTKQLAIYINGKIRSNSIFCSRSASSNSFTGILKSHFYSAATGTGTKTNANTKTCANNSRLVTDGGDTQRKQQQPGEPVVVVGAPDEDRLGGGGKPGFVNCLIPSVCKRTARGAAAGRSRFGCFRTTTKTTTNNRQDAIRSSKQSTSTAASTAPNNSGWLWGWRQRRLGSRLNWLRLTGFDCEQCWPAAGCCGCHCCTSQACQTRLTTTGPNGDEDEQLKVHEEEQEQQHEDHESRIQLDLNERLEGSNQQDQDQEEQPEEPKTYKLNPSSMFLRKAMRYYRLWIYSANLIILLGAIIFVLSALYVTSDYRFQLVVAPNAQVATTRTRTLTTTRTTQDTDGSDGGGGVPVSSTLSSSSLLRDDDNTGPTSANAFELAPELLPPDGGSNADERFSFSIGLSEPVMVLAYLMIAVQLGVLQAIGCFGAIRMKERLIQAFWYLILALILIDVMILVYWLQRYDVILKSLRHEMTARLNLQYGRQDELGEFGVTQSSSSPGSFSIIESIEDRGNNDYSNNNNNKSNTGLSSNDDDDTLASYRRELDKTFTQILDRIQASSKCCGISNSLDYRHSHWRRQKVSQLQGQLKKHHQRQQQQHQDQHYHHDVREENLLLGQLALVPASCCMSPMVAAGKRNIYSDYWKAPSQRASYPPTANQLSATSATVWPSAYPQTDNLSGFKQGGGGASLPQPSQPQAAGDDDEADNDGESRSAIAVAVAAGGGGDDGAGEPNQRRRPTLADVIDRRWSGRGLILEGAQSGSGVQVGGGSDNEDAGQVDGSDDGGDDSELAHPSKRQRPPYSNKRARFVTKQMHYEPVVGELSPTNSNGETTTTTGARLRAKRAALSSEHADEEQKTRTMTKMMMRKTTTNTIGLGTDEQSGENYLLGSDVVVAGSPDTRSYLAHNYELEQDSEEEDGGRRMTSLDVEGPTVSVGPGEIIEFTSQQQQLDGDDDDEDDDDDNDNWPQSSSGGSKAPVVRHDDHQPVWAVESKLDQRGRVLSRLIELIDTNNKTRRQLGQQQHPQQQPEHHHHHHHQQQQQQQQSDSGEGKEIQQAQATDSQKLDSAESWRTQLNSLRQLLFVAKFQQNVESQQQNDSAANFIWPNELGLNYRQFKLLESYLNEQIAEAEVETASINNNDVNTEADRKSSTSSKTLRRRSANPTLLSPAPRLQQGHNGQSAESGHVDTKQPAAASGPPDDSTRRSYELIRELVHNDSQLGCLARSYYDKERIYTRGCQPQIKAWLQSSANILFITGFCVLTVLKFCSLILLRLEIREMIHKIRVLRGMATEYNALQDLEPYLPRPSVCAQAAELTPTGVSPALGGTGTGGTGLGSPTGGLPPIGMGMSAGETGGQGAGTAMGNQHTTRTASCGSPTNAGMATPLVPVPRRLGGSFSEAVAAAAAVAHQQRLAEHQQQQLQRHLRDYERAASFANCARAASTKTIMGGGGGGSGCSCAGLSMTSGNILNAPQHSQGLGTGSLCPCSSSMSMAAHLNHSASQLTAAAAAAAAASSHQYHQQQRHQQGVGGGGSSNYFRSEMFPGGLASMPRRHTAISVCPAAAAAAAAAAHHLMMRRGTFAIANAPLTFGNSINSTASSNATSQHQQQQLRYQSSGGGLGGALSAAAACASVARHSSSSMLQAKSLNYLNQHRHSAHAVPPSHMLFRSSGDTSGGHTGAGATNFLLPNNNSDKLSPFRRPSSGLVHEGPAASIGNPAAGGKRPLLASSNQLDPAAESHNPPFKRQVSGGAQSAVNFSLDIAPVQLTESRRSIH